MNGKPGPPRKVPIVIRDGDTVRVIPATICEKTLSYRRSSAKRLEAGLCRDCGKRRNIPKHRTEPFKHRCAGCQRTANAHYRRWYRRQKKAR